MKKFNYKVFGRVIKDNRADMDIDNNVRSVAKRIGIPFSTLSRAENGHNIDLNNLLNIMSFYNIPITDIENYFTYDE